MKQKMGKNYGLLPLELLVDILSRLPIKILGRFSCVSKAWRNLISSSAPGSVKKIYEQRPKRRPYLVLWNFNCFDDQASGPESPSLKRVTVVDMFEARVHDEFDTAFPFFEYDCMQSCHGLIFISSNYRDYNVWNPSTRESRKIPRYHTEEEICPTGLGYLPSKNQYKFVIWHYLARTSADDFGCKILTLTEDEIDSSEGWRAGKPIPYSTFICGIDGSEGWRAGKPIPYCTLSCEAICVSGVIYWLSWGAWVQSANQFLDNLAILSFDLETEEARMIPCSKFCQTSHFNLIEMNGNLCYGDFLKEQSVLNIWLLRNNVWEQKHRISTACSVSHPIGLVAHISRDCNDEELVLKTEAETLIYYNLKSRRYREPEHLVDIRISEYDPSLICFDSFFSLGGP